LVDIPNFPLPKDIHKDELFNSMQHVYEELAEIPREAFIFLENLPFFSLSPFHEVPARMKSGKSLDTIGDPYEVRLNG
jgi:hypothetical protein